MRAEFFILCFKSFSEVRKLKCREKSGWITFYNFVKITVAQAQNVTGFGKSKNDLKALTKGGFIWEEAFVMSNVTVTIIDFLIEDSNRNFADIAYKIFEDHSETPVIF